MINQILIKLLDSILHAREHFPSNEFPILVSQDCGHEETLKMIKKYSASNEDIQYIEQLDRSPIPGQKANMQGYFKLRIEFDKF